MEPIIDAPGGDDRDFRPEPRDLMVVVMDYVKAHGVQSEEQGPGEIEIDVWKIKFEGGGILLPGVSPVILDVEHRIEGEFDDHLIVTTVDSLGSRVTLHAHDNTFQGVKFLNGDIQQLNHLYEIVKPLVEAEGGTF